MKNIFKMFNIEVRASQFWQHDSVVKNPFDYRYRIQILAVRNGFVKYLDLYNNEQGTMSVNELKLDYTLLEKDEKNDDIHLSYFGG